MLQLMIVLVILAMIIFLWLKNKHDNRNIERHNRLVEKREALLEMLRKQNKDDNNYDN